VHARFREQVFHRHRLEMGATVMGGHGKPHRTTKILSHARRCGGVAAHIAHAMKDLDAKQTMLQGIMFVLQ